MKLYLGSLQVEDKPTITSDGKNFDYGKGFYATPSRPKARVCAQQLMHDCRAAHCYVNVYEFDESVMKSLNCLVFKEPSEEWLKFVFDNRTKRGFSHNYDIVFGPFANDKTYEQFEIFEGDLVSEPYIVRKIKTFKLVNQYLFHTPRALEALQFIEAIPISSAQEDVRMFLPSKIMWMVEYLHDDFNLSIQDALARIYNSNLYKKLSTESTKYWHLGPVDLYDELLQELGDLKKNE